MSDNTNILNQISPLYFWDVNFSKLDANKSRRLIIERVFSLGKLEEMGILLHHYGKEEVLEILTRVNYLDPKTLNFVSKLFKVPLTRFTCYTRKHLHPTHWDS